MFESKIIRQFMNNIFSDKHVLSVNEVNKIVLSRFGTKRFYDDDRINSFAFGHYKTGQTQKVSYLPRSKQKSEIDDKCQQYISVDEGEIKNKYAFEKTDFEQSQDTETCKDVQYNSDKSFSEETDFVIDSPDPGFAGTAERSSDESDVADWDAPIHQKLHKNVLLMMMKA